MNAIGIYMLDHNSDINILYVSSETFTNDFIGGAGPNRVAQSGQELDRKTHV